MIFLANRLKNNQQPILGVMDILVDRNAFGRQIDSFETHLDIQGLDDPFHAVFIRAPVTLDDGRIVAAQQGHLLATAFHPELTDDTRLHEFFANIVSSQLTSSTP
jgi:5'-phosphate synthase pdxT subunit